VLNWLENYRRERQDKTPGKVDVYGRSRVASGDELVKRPSRTKRGLEIELEQENSMPSMATSTVMAISSSSHQLAVNVPSAAAVASSSSALDYCTPTKHSKSILEERLVMSAHNPNTPPSSSRKTLSDITASNVLMPKKRWLREAFSEQQQSSNSEVLARPIRWSEEDEMMEAQEQQQLQRRSPKSLIVATALVELASDKTMQLLPPITITAPQPQQLLSIQADQSQPLNLSVNSR
jgi:hypothetical protein